MTRPVLYRLMLSFAFVRAKGIAAQYTVEIKFLTIVLATFIGSDYVKSLSTSAEYLFCGLALMRKYGRFFGAKDGLG
jgi:hypothetical protein